jgi:hypothetical protein
MFWVVCSWCCTVVSTGITSDWSSANAAIPSASTANVTGGCERTLRSATKSSL